MLSPELVFCAAGNARFATIAMKYGFTYGAQLPNTIYFAPQFVDQDWKNPDRAKYMNALRDNKPRIATVLDLERDDQLDEVLSWANEASQYIQDVIIIIPKAQSIIARLPREINGKQVRLGYSVPTAFGGTQVPIWEFIGWSVHLLGGSPQEQMKLARYLNVVSTDGNYAQKMATRFNQYFASAGASHYAKNRYWPQLQETALGKIENDACYVAFELSCINIQAAWHGSSYGLRFAALSDIPVIKKIANQWKNELGFVNSAALKESVNRRTLCVAFRNTQIVGFVNFRRRLDNRSTIYEIAVDKAYKGSDVGRALLCAVPKPIQLKCTIDNPANGFYEHVGFKLIATEAGRKRALNVWGMQS